MLILFFKGYHVAQVRVIFKLRKDASRLLFGEDHSVPEYLAYVQWFNLSSNTKPDSLLYQAKRSIKDGDRLASIVALANIRRSVHLFPNFGQVVAEDWTSENVLEKCQSFYVNPFSDRHAYHTIV
jgi:hypothetical protein